MDTWGEFVMPAVPAFFAGVGALIKGAAATYATLTAFQKLAVLVVFNFGANEVLKLLAPSVGASTSDGKVNVKISAPIRWINYGRVRQGGGVMFAEHDEQANFWILIVHSDSILDDTVQYYFDDIGLELSGTEVTTDEFVLRNNKDLDPYEGEGDFRTWYDIYTTTYSHDNPTPPAITALQTAFPTLWTSTHKLVGTTYSVIRINTIGQEHRHKIYRWRGAIGLGEPALSIVGDWNVVYDPRNEAHDIDDNSTWTYSNNTALVWAAFRTHPKGRDKPMDSINWNKLSIAADKCDEEIIGQWETQARYTCNIAIADNKTRIDAEKEILETADATIHFDDTGKSYIKVASYEAPEITLTRNRDVIAMESTGTDNLETPYAGVVVNYIDPLAKYTEQTSAPWKSPRYYVDGSSNTFLTVSILACNNHHQALRLAKIIGERLEVDHKIAPTTGLRSLLLYEERLVNIPYDDTISGVYEIVSNIETDNTGSFCAFAAIPTTASRYDLTQEEDVQRDASNVTVTPSQDLDPPSFTASINNSVIVVTPSAAPRDGTYLQFEYSIDDDTLPDYPNYINMSSVNSANSVAYSPSINPNLDYIVRGRTVSSSGIAGDYSSTVSVSGQTLLQLAGTPITTVVVGAAYDFTITASGGTSPYYFEDIYSTLPAGISLNTSTGQVQGNPTTVGTYSGIVIRCTSTDTNNNVAIFPSFDIEVTAS